MKIKIPLPVNPELLANKFASPRSRLNCGVFGDVVAEAQAEMQYPSLYDDFRDPTWRELEENQRFPDRARRKANIEKITRRISKEAGVTLWAGKDVGDAVIIDIPQKFWKEGFIELLNQKGWNASIYTGPTPGTGTWD